MQQLFWQQRLSERQEQVLSPGCVTVGIVVIAKLVTRVWLRERKEVKEEHDNNRSTVDYIWSYPDFDG